MKHYVLVSCIGIMLTAANAGGMQPEQHLSIERLSEFWQAFNSGDNKKVKELLPTVQLSALVTSNPENNSKLLAYAAKKGKLDLVSLLLEHNTDPNQPDSNGITPLAHAIKKLDSTLVELVLKYHANPNQWSVDPEKINDGKILPLALALDYCYYDYNTCMHITKLLLDHGAYIYQPYTGANSGERKPLIDVLRQSETTDHYGQTFISDFSMGFIIGTAEDELGEITATQVNTNKVHTPMTDTLITYATKHRKSVVDAVAKPFGSVVYALAYRELNGKIDPRLNYKHCLLTAPYLKQRP